MLPSNVHGYFNYFNSAVTSCYSGTVTISSANVGYINSTAGGSCLALGLSKISCASTYGCAILSSAPSTTVAVGHTLTFSCGVQSSCDNTPGYNCCTTNNCNCNNALSYVANKFVLIAMIMAAFLYTKF